MENNQKAQLVLYASFITRMDGESFIRIVTNSQRNRDENNAVWIGWDAKNKEQDISRTGNPKGELLSLLAKFPDHQTIHLEFNEKIEDCAIREINEEVGITIKNIKK